MTGHILVQVLDWLKSPRNSLDHLVHLTLHLENSHPCPPDEFVQARFFPTLARARRLQTLEIHGSHCHDNRLRRVLSAASRAPQLRRLQLDFAFAAEGLFFESLYERRNHALFPCLEELIMPCAQHLPPKASRWLTSRTLRRVNVQCTGKGLLTPSSLAPTASAFADLIVCALSSKARDMDVCVRLDPRWPSSCFWRFTAQEVADISAHVACDGDLRLQFIGLDPVQCCSIQQEYPYGRIASWAFMVTEETSFNEVYQWLYDSLPPSAESLREIHFFGMGAAAIDCFLDELFGEDPVIRHMRLVNHFDGRGTPPRRTMEYCNHRPEPKVTRHRWRG